MYSSKRLEITLRGIADTDLHMRLFVAIYQAAMAVWVTILRFMGDLPDVKYGSNNGASQVRPS